MRITVQAALFSFVLLHAFPALAGSPSDSPQQPTEVFALHPRFGWIKNFHTADFRSFQGAIDCGVFTEGDGQGLSFSLTGEYPLSERAFVGLGIGFIDRSATLVNPGSFPARDTSTKQVVTVYTENTLQTTLKYLELQPEFRYTLVPNLLRGPLRGVAALRVGFPMTSTFEQSEKIVSPSNAAFTSTGSRTQQRAIASGEIYTRSSTSIGATAGLENMLRMGSNLFFTQQVLFDYNITNIATDVSWKAYGFRIEAGVRYAFMSTPPAPPEPEPVIDTVVTQPVVEVEPPPPPPKPIASIRVDNVITDSSVLEVGNELLATLPLVNAVFFEKNSASIPERYVQEAGHPKPDDAVAAHRFILVDIADIIRKNPDARITLYGATSGRDDEPEGNKLAEERAESVRAALVELGVPNGVLTVRSAALPPNPSNQEFEEGRVENRRVDIMVQNAPLQEYVAQQRYAELQSVVTGRVSLQHFPADAVATVRSNVRDTSIQLASSGSFAIPFSRRVDANQSDVLRVVTTVEATDLDIQSSDRTDIAIAQLPVREVELNLDKFEPILRFDYNKSTLSEANRDLLRQMLQKLPKGSVITILGSADALGAEKRNEQLSRERAASVEKFIRSIAGDAYQITSSGADAKFSDATPEGRFLNRSIRIRVQQ